MVAAEATARRSVKMIELQGIGQLVTSEIDRWTSLITGRYLLQ